MAVQRWGFEEDDGWEDQPDGGGPPPTDEDTVRGADPKGVVTAVATPAGEPVAVRLGTRWAERAGSSGLPDLVRAAANGATAAALARQVSALPLDEAGASAPAGAVGPADGHPPDGGAEDPIAAMNRLLVLMDTVSAQLDQFERRLGAVGAVVAKSSGGHVTVNGRDGQVLDVDVDPGWAGSARVAEIEGEVLDALREFHRRTSPDELAAGPQGPAITELDDLVRNPPVLLRRLGLSR